MVLELNNQVIRGHSFELENRQNKNKMRIWKAMYTG